MLGRRLQPPSLTSDVQVPDPPESLEGFPEAVLGPPVSLLRVHRQREPWYFASAGDGGRFDLAAPEGTCYGSDSHLGAFVEHFGPLIAPGRAIPLRALRARHLSNLEIDGQLRLADLTARSALGRFGITVELSVTVEYEKTRLWAAAFAAAGFDGIRYTARHDPAAQLRSIALFGKAGVTPLGSADSQALPPWLILKAATAFGITVAPELLP